MKETTYAFDPTLDDRCAYTDNHSDRAFYSLRTCAGANRNRRIGVANRQPDPSTSAWKFLWVHDMFDDVFTGWAVRGHGRASEGTFGDRPVRDTAMLHARIAQARSESTMNLADDLVAVRNTLERLHLLAGLTVTVRERHS